MQPTGLMSQLGMFNVSMLITLSMFGLTEIRQYKRFGKEADG